MSAEQRVRQAVYFVEVQSNEGVARKRFVKMPLSCCLFPGLDAIDDHVLSIMK